MQLGVLLVTLAHTALGACKGGDSVCRARVGKDSWCKPESGTCQGGPSILCECDDAILREVAADVRRIAVGVKIPGARKMDSICTALDPGSWCREDFMCAKMNQVYCGVVSEEARPPRQLIARAIVRVPRRVAAVVPASSNVGKLIGEKGGEKVDSICTALDPASWCRDDLRCSKGHGSVYCGSGRLPDVAAKKTHKEAEPAPKKTHKEALKKHEEAPKTHKETETTLKKSHTSKTARRSHHTQSMALWTEWPTLEEGQWPEYFDTLLSFISENCGGLGFHKLIMRVLDPSFQASRGQLWQVSKNSAFYKNFLVKLPSNIEVHIYPYLLDRHSANNWSRIMETESALEAAFKYVHTWNRLLDTTSVKVRLGGVVTDKEEGRHFLSDAHKVGKFKQKYSGSAKKRLTFGMAIGYDQAGSIPALNADGELDDVYLEMYDFYVEGVVPAKTVHAHKGGALNNPERFLQILDEEVWYRHVDKYHHHSNIIFMWSVQNDASTHCVFPSNEITCGTKGDFGSWKMPAFTRFLETIAKRHKVFANRQHGLFQFSFVPKNWMSGTC